MTNSLPLAGSGGGGGGKPFIAFGGSSSSSSVTCRNDPENPGQQNCKRVERITTRDPLTGQTVSFWNLFHPTFSLTLLFSQRGPKKAKSTDKEVAPASWEAYFRLPSIRVSNLHSSVEGLVDHLQP